MNSTKSSNKSSQSHVFVLGLEEFIDKVICGDSAEILKQLPPESVDTIVTSPPYYGQRDYGAPVNSYDKIIGNEPTPEEYVNNLMAVFSECVRVTKKSGSIFFNVGDKYGNGSLLLVPYLFVREAVKRTKVNLINQITWIKPNPQPRQFKRRLVSSTEPIFHFVKGEEYQYYPKAFMEGQAITRNNKKAHDKIGMKYFGLIEKSDLTNQQKQLAKKELEDVIQEVKEGKIWSFRMKIRGIHSAAYGGYEGGRKEHIRVKGFTIIRMYDRPMKRDVIETPILSLKYLKHPAIYPETLVQELLNLTTLPHSVVLDPFLGSGTTAVVAKRMGRHFIGIDINKKYCDAAIKRIKETVVEPALREFIL